MEMNGSVVQILEHGILVQVHADFSGGGGLGLGGYSSARAPVELPAGIYFLVGHPRAKSLVDRDAVQVKVRLIGKYRFGAETFRAYTVVTK